MGKRQSRPPTRALEQRRPSRYPIPVTGITPDRDCGALGLAPPRPIISPGIPAPPVPLGIIGIIGIPGELGSPVSAAGWEYRLHPSPTSPNWPSEPAQTPAKSAEPTCLQPSERYPNPPPSPNPALRHRMP